MPLTEEDLTTVVSIAASRQHGTTAGAVPVGTGFVVSVPARRHPGLAFLYVVTAKSVIEDEASVMVRAKRSDGTMIDMPADDWVVHPTADLALAPFVDRDGLVYKHIRQQDFVSQSPIDETLGYGVYFVEVVESAPALVREPLTLVTAAMLSVRYQPDVLLDRPGHEESRATAHLVECRSRRVRKGSPCFVNFHQPKAGVSPLTFESRLCLLGMVCGHVPLDDPSTLSVAVVVPVEHIEELLHADRVVAMRKRVEDQLPPPRRARADDAPLFTRADFDYALGRIVRASESRL